MEGTTGRTLMMMWSQCFYHAIVIVIPTPTRYNPARERHDTIATTTSTAAAAHLTSTSLHSRLLSTFEILKETVGVVRVKTANSKYFLQLYAVVIFFFFFIFFCLIEFYYQTLKCTQYQIVTWLLLNSRLKRSFTFSWNCRSSLRHCCAAKYDELHLDQVYSTTTCCQIDFCREQLCECCCDSQTVAGRSIKIFIQ